MQIRIGRAVALVAATLGWTGSVLATGERWQVCRAETPVQAGTVHAVQSEPFDARPMGDIDTAMQVQRPFEAALRALGATGLKDATVACTGPVLESAEAVTAGKALREKAIAAHPTPKPELVEGPWTVTLKRGPVDPIVLLAGSELASPATLASSPEAWGLSAADFSKVYNRALLAKAGMPGRMGDMEAAAAKGDAYAQYLAALRPPGVDDDAVLMQKAADQGLVRAIVDLHMPLAVKGAADPKPHLAELKKMARLGSAHAKYFAGRAFLTHKPLTHADSSFAIGSLLEADKQEYAPAMLWVAHDLRNSADEYQWRGGRERARLAAAQGLPEAQEFLERNPERWPVKP